MKYVSLVLRVDCIFGMGSAESLSLCKGPAVIQKLRNIAIYGGRVVERSVLVQDDIDIRRSSRTGLYHFLCLCDPKPQDYFECLFHPDLEVEGLNFVSISNSLFRCRLS
jgi:hypothetical protein